MTKKSYETKTKEGVISVRINPKIYPLDIVLSASYVFTDRCYVVVDGDPTTEVLVELRPKKETDLEKITGEFQNELLNYASYAVQSLKNQVLREAIITRVLKTNDLVRTPVDYCPPDNTQTKLDSTESSWEEKDESVSDVNNEKVDSEEPWFDDPEGIAVPWEEKYGQKANSDKEEEKPWEKEKVEDKPWFDDPEGIAVPWEEKYGKDKGQE